MSRLRCLEKQLIAEILYAELCGQLNKLRSDARHPARCVECLLSLVLKADFSIGSLRANKAALVNEVVMMPAQHDQVIQTCFATIGPVLYVVSIDKSGVGTAREATSFVSDAERAAHWGWNSP